MTSKEQIATGREEHPTFAMTVIFTNCPMFCPKVREFFGRRQRLGFWMIDYLIADNFTFFPKKVYFLLANARWMSFIRW